MRAAGGRPLVNRVGHAFFKTRMREEGGVFGGEVSGHYYFADFYNADSGTLPALLVLELLGRTGRTLTELLEPYRSRYFISGEINSVVADPAAKLEELRARYADAEITALDGISIDYDDWHFNVRASNTEPLLRLCLESLVSEADMAAPPRRGARPDPRLSRQARLAVAIARPSAARSWEESPAAVISPNPWPANRAASSGSRQCRPQISPRSAQHARIRSIASSTGGCSSRPVGCSPRLRARSEGPM